MINKKHVGSNFDDFLEEEGILDEVEAVAIKRIIAYELEQEIQKRNMTKTELAEHLSTSRAALNRLLDPQNTSISLKTMEKIARFLGKKLKISFA